MHSSTARVLSLFVISLGAGCLEDTTGEEDHDDFSSSDGKSDGHGILEDSPEARGVLRVANELSRTALRDDVGLSAAAARNILVHRSGNDENDGTSDDNPFGSLAELDSVAWVGPSSFAKLLAYAIDQGWVAVEDPENDLALPGPACAGQLTELGRLNLFATKPITGLPAFMHLSNGVNAQARQLGPYTSTFYKRTCDTAIGCAAWMESAPTTDSYISNLDTLRAGHAYLWATGATAGPSLDVGIVSMNVGTNWDLHARCDGWVQGFGGVVRTGDQASVTLATEEDHSCPAGATPYPSFQGRDLHDPTGIVTDHCFKLTMSRKGYRTQIAPDRFVYPEYLVVYDATY